MLNIVKVKFCESKFSLKDESNCLNLKESFHDLPRYETSESAGVDLRSEVEETIKPFERKMIRTGMIFELPKNVEAQIRPRSGLALKHGVTVLNSPGTIDPDYRGEISVILINFGKDDFFITKGMRIAQIVFSKIERVNFVECLQLSLTERNDGGFGSTGVN